MLDGRQVGILGVAVAVSRGTALQKKCSTRRDWDIALRGGVDSCSEDPAENQENTSQSKSRG